MGKNSDGGISAVRPKAPIVVTVHANDFAFDGPKTMKPGATTFRLVNDGKELHHLTLIRLAKGKSFKGFTDAMKVEGPPPVTMAEATRSLEPGEYVMICFIPSRGEHAPHASTGMVNSFTVSEAGERRAMPKGDVTIKLTDYHFEISKTLTAGEHLINDEGRAARTQNGDWRCH